MEKDRTVQMNVRLPEDVYLRLSRRQLDLQEARGHKISKEKLLINYANIGLQQEDIKLG